MTLQWKRSVLWIVVCVLLLAGTAFGVAADNWYIKGGDSGLQNYSQTMDQGFYYQYATNESNLTDNQNVCVPATEGWASTTTCVQPSLANREDFGYFSDVGQLWWHPSSTKGGTQITFVAPETGEYFYNVSGTKYTGGNNVNFSVKKHDNTVLHAVTVGGGGNYNDADSVNITAGQTLKFILETADSDAGDSTGIVLNISSVPSASPPASTNPPSFIEPTPANNSHNFSQVNITAECDSGNTTIVYFNSSFPPITQVSNGTGNHSYITTVTSDGAYFYNAQCFDSALGYSENETTRTWVYDTTSPAINLRTSNEFSSDNYSLLDQYDDVFQFNFTVADDIALYGLLINVTKDGTSYYNISNTSLSGTTWTFEKELDISSWATGTYNIQIEASDSHTKNKIKDYDVTKRNKKLEFDTVEGNNIVIESTSDATTDTEKVEDRYTFDFDFDTTKNAEVFHVTSNNYIDYLGESKYDAHFVIWNSETRQGNWIDFESTDASVSKIKKVTDYHYEVTIKTNKKNIKFESIGGLNVNEVNYTWFRGSYVDQTSDYGITQSTFDFVLNLSVDWDTIQSIYATNLTWCYNDTENNTAHCSSVDPVYTNYTVPSPDRLVLSNTETMPDDNVTVSYAWYLNVLQKDGNTTTKTINDTMSLQYFGFDDCTIGSEVSILFYIYNEELTGDQLIADFEWETTSYYDDPLVTQTNYDNQTGRNNYSICINPSYATLVADGYFRYTVASGYTHRYYLVNHTLNNATQTINIYNWNNTGASDMRITTRLQESYNYFPNVVAKLQRRYIADNVWRTVQMDKSSEFGLLFFNIREEDTDYRLIYQDDAGNILKTTDTSKFSCTSGICEITQLLDPFSATTVKIEPEVTISYSNDTRLITAVWSMPDGTTKNVTFNAFKVGGANMTLMCTDSQLASAGTFTCNTTGQTGTAYVVIDVSGFSPTFAEFITMVRTTLADVISDGDASIFIVAIILMLGLSALYHPVAVVVMSGVSVAFLMFFGIGGGFLTLTFVAVIIALSIIVSYVISMRRGAG